VSLYRVAAPVIVAGLATNLLWMVDQEVIIPRLAPRLARQHEDVEGRQARKLYFVEDRDNSLLTALEFYPSRQRMHELIVVGRDEAGNMTDVLRADSATYDEDRHVWLLERGVLHRPADPESGSNETIKVPVDVYESDLTPDYLSLRQAALWLDLLSMRQLSRLGAADYVDPRRVAQIRHGRFALPFMNLILLVLGLPFFLNRQPEGIVVQAGKCLLNCGLCFSVTFVSQQMISSETYPALTAWFPMMVFGPLAVLYLDAVKT
jgi:lipopolysaccharide export LptBFGC system permease protein LptF